MPPLPRGWSGAAAGAAGVFREGGVRRRRQRLRVEVAEGERERKEERGRESSVEEAGPAGLFTAAGGRGGGAAPCPRSLQPSRTPTRG